MLYILTGEIQIGKTRWLRGLIDELQEKGVPLEGVLAPGVWKPNPDKPNGFEKLGIDNVMLPSGEVVPFARRRDLASGETSKMELQGMPADMKLAWAFSDEAIERVNAHFAGLASGEPPARPGLLVVDELGRLELERGGLGLTEAVNLVARGPRPGWPHALIVVRDWLVPRARMVFGPAWNNEIREVGPTPKTVEDILGLFVQ